MKVYTILLVMTLPGTQQPQQCVGQAHQAADLIDSMLFVMKNYFRGKCLCVYRFELENGLDLMILKVLHRVRAFYLMAPVNGDLSRIPYPCFYITLVGGFKDFNSVKPNHSVNFTLVEEVVESRYVIVSSKTMSRQEVTEALVRFFNIGHPDAVVLNLENQINVYTLFPFGTGLDSCPEDGMLLKKIDSWSNSSFHVDLFPEKVPEVFNNCYLNVSFVQYPPYIYYDGDEVEGLDSEVVQIVGETLNMKIGWIEHPFIFYLGENSSFQGSAPDIMYGRAQVACGGLVTMPLNKDAVASTRTYANSHLTWYLPYPPLEPMWQTLFKAFSPELLVVTVATMLAAPLALVMVANTSRGELDCLRNTIRCYLAAWSLAVANTTGIRPQTMAVRILYVAWLLCTIHLALAYSASLTGLLTKNLRSPRVNSFQYLKATGLPTAMTPIHHYTTLNIKDPDVRSALDNYVIINNTDEAINIIKIYHNMSLLDNSFTVDHKICSTSRRPLLYNSGLTTFPMQSGLMLRRSHYLHHRIDRVVIRLIESGLNDEIVRRITNCRRQSGKGGAGEFRATTLRGVGGVFIVLGFGNLLATIVFFVELYVYRRNNSNSRKRVTFVRSK